MDGWMDGRTDGWKDGRTDGRAYGQKGVGTDGRTDGRTNVRTHGWTNGQTDGRTDGWTDGRMDGRTIVFMEPVVEISVSFIIKNTFMASCKMISNVSSSAVAGFPFVRIIMRSNDTWTAKIK